jgi:hypothetical protein
VIWTNNGRRVIRFRPSEIKAFLDARSNQAGAK